MRFASVAAFAALPFALSACSHTDEPTAQQAIDSVVLAEEEGAILAVSADGIAATMTAVDAAQNAVDRVTAVFGAACVEATRSLATVTFTLDDCSGPFGLVHVTGQVTVTFAVATDGLHARAKATRLVASGALVEIDAEGVYERAVGSQQLSITTSGAGHSRGGNDFARKGSYAVRWDDASNCLTLDGMWSTRLLVDSATTTVRSFARCGAACPVAGGEIVQHADAEDVTIDVAFNGTNAAHWTSSRHGEGDVQLDCP